VAAQEQPTSETRTTVPSQDFTTRVKTMQVAKMTWLHVQALAMERSASPGRGAAEHRRRGLRMMCVRTRVVANETAVHIRRAVEPIWVPWLVKSLVMSVQPWKVRSWERASSEIQQDILLQTI
jgi:hypothetical protein